MCRIQFMCSVGKRLMSELSGILINVNGRKNRHEKNNSTHKTLGMLFSFNCFFINYESRDCFKDIDKEI